jgi:hypothetical protein
VMESPLIQEMMAKKGAQTMHNAIVRFLARRFGSVPEEMAAAVQTIYDESKLEELVDEAASCPDLEAFRVRLGR